MDFLNWSFPKCTQISSWHNEFHTEPADLPKANSMLYMCYSKIIWMLFCPTSLKWLRDFLFTFFSFESKKVHTVSDTAKFHEGAIVDGFRAKTSFDITCYHSFDTTWVSLPSMVEWLLLSCCQSWVGEGSRERANAKPTANQVDNPDYQLEEMFPQQLLTTLHIVSTANWCSVFLRQWDTA